MKKPLYVAIGLFGVPTKKSANMYKHFCIAVGLLFLLAGMFVDQKYFVGQVLFLSALWYQAAIIWMDTNDQWKNKGWI